ncbi:septal ring lytic transglycosylase RlpA family protein [Erythrobacter sp. BLCC-B19]|uniref:septal ring lytic transglycosylase RlpA family protein n=1 Tax=Erythrobacter sp. BLCC-B19 TaxID=3025315 RepID=UPI002361B5DA|nr:septal ring lytic transglycosylase RlpA family protein [Erythrobacter sp. BLCC-B19]WDA40342.1 septal ring lytic transglycosylase RlpA family protein [Erythrobacter sp. BLCC-B19]
MRRENRIHGLGARSLAQRSVQAAAIAALFGLAPIAASTAATTETATAAAIEPAASAALIELVPVQPAADVTLPAAIVEAPAPSAPQETVLGRGSASYYAAKFDGRRTASGERFDNDDMTAAHRTLPFGTLVRVTNVATGRSVVVRINDRGPFTRGRMIDVSRAAAEELGLVARGHATVELAVIED